MALKCRKGLATHAILPYMLVSGVKVGLVFVSNCLLMYTLAVYKVVPKIG